MPQLKFNCSDDLYKKLKTEKVLQGRKLQDLCNEALQIALDGWERDRLYQKDFEEQAELDHKLHVGEIEFRDEVFRLKKGEFRKVSLWLACIRTLPEETHAALFTLMRDCVDFFAATRRKV